MTRPPDSSTLYRWHSAITAFIADAEVANVDRPSDQRVDVMGAHRVAEEVYSAYRDALQREVAQ